MHTGHRLFRSYLFKQKRMKDDLCIYSGPVDTPNHTVFKCERWKESRAWKKDDEGNYDGNDWKLVVYIVEEVLGIKEKKEREIWCVYQIEEENDDNNNDDNDDGIWWQ